MRKIGFVVSAVGIGSLLLAFLFMTSGCASIQKVAESQGGAIGGFPVDPQPPVAVASNCTCGKTYVEPDQEILGGECVNALGDVRYLVWSKRKGDWIFFGHFAAKHKLATREGNKISGWCKRIDGVDYHYRGYRVPSSRSPMVEERTGEYRSTYRVYFEPRRGE